MKFALLAIVIGCAQRKPVVEMKEDPRWKQVDSLAATGLFASALEITEAIAGEARKSGDWRTEFRALMNAGNFKQAIGIPREQLILELEQRVTSLEVDSSSIPLVQLLHSVLGGSYWSYYQQERWRILDRTNAAPPADTAELSTWDQRMFMQKVIGHFQASIEPFDTLKHIPAGELGELLEWPYATPRPVPGTPYTRSGNFEEPLLIDILARRAIDIFRNSETRLAEPAWRFKLDDPAFFALYEDLTQRRLHHRDSASWEFQALLTWQRWERAHLSDDHPAILTSIMLDRLRFVKERSTLEEKDSLYLEALEQIGLRVRQQPVWSEVNVAIASWHAEKAHLFQRLVPGEYKWEKRTAATLCDSAIARFPGSIGAMKAQALKAQLTATSIDVVVEEAVIRDQPFKIALGHMNAQKVHLRIVDEPPSVQQQDRWGPDLVKWLLQQKVVREWSVDLPDDGDMNRHLAELPVEALPAGRYAILASMNGRFSAENELAVASFWSTRIAVAERTRNGKLELLLLDRSTGRSLNDAKVELWTLDHQQGDRQFKKTGSDLPVSEGRTTAELQRNSITSRFQITLPDGDRFITAPAWSWHHQEELRSDSIRTFLFTDRAIYRPGQTIHFKGITTVHRNGTTVAKEGRTTLVKLFNVNEEVVDSIELATDAFGAFHGTFTAPGGLTGHMRIATPEGSTSMLVEEYKRPKFEVTFDPIGTSAKLDQRVDVAGKVKAYSGVPIGNAEVKWTVTRMARMPWWSDQLWRGFPGWGRPVEIASGTDTTDGDGSFNIEFIATGDGQLPRKADPIFVYTIEAVATDPSGETQHNSMDLNLGYKSIGIDLGIGDAIDRSTTDSLAIQVQNMNGVAVERPIDITIHRLSAPALPFRERKGEIPDSHVIPEEAHRALFPFDPYSNENDPLEWKKDSLVLEMRSWNSRGKKIPLPNLSNWTVGKYLIEVSTIDKDGEEVKVQRPVTIYDPQIQNTGFLAEAFHVEQVSDTAGLQPGEKASFLVSSALGEGRIGMEVERSGAIAAVRWFNLQRGQQLVELPILESDRGGFAVHFVAVVNGREFRTTKHVAVPWENKRLKVEWTTFRDRMLPGSLETFRLKISGPDGGPVAAQMLASMYDASLDHFVPHAWEMFQWPQYQSVLQWDRMQPFHIVHGQASIHPEMPRDTIRPFPSLRTFGWPLGLEFPVLYSMDAEAGGVMMRGDAANSSVQKEEVQMVAVNGMVPKEPDRVVAGPGASVDQPVRSNFNETAFFLPDLLTDADGSVIMEFTMPDALTRWRFMGLAHTRELEIAQFDREVITQKPMMVMPNLPRFLRQGDRIELVSRIDVLEGDPINGAITLELFDPYTNRSLDTDLKLDRKEQPFTAAQGESGSATWRIEVPATIDLVGIRINARSTNGFNDGEQHVLPVLSDRLLVTESLPLPIGKAGTRNFTFEALGNDTSSTLRHQSLKLEFTPNPAWYAVQALPYLTGFPHECSEQVFSRFYANTLAAHIVAEEPAIRKVVEAWRAAAARGGSELMSALEKNPELKSVLLEETPWVMRAADERQRKVDLVLLFDMDRMAREQAASLRKLQELQLADGSWPWFSGMFPSLEVTQHITAGIGHLRKLDAADPDRDMQVRSMLDRAIAWMDSQADERYERARKDLTKEELDHFVPGYADVQYLYARSFFMDRPFTAEAAQAAAFIGSRVSAEWLKYGLQEQAMIALALHRSKGESNDVAGSILRSLKERATQDEELGMYWRNFSNGISWAEFPTETHALLIEAFHDISNDTAAVNGLRMHLLKLKQTTDWRTTKATANACYALLLIGNDLLEEAASPVIKVGGVPIEPQKKEAGAGYFTHSWEPEQIKPELADISIAATSDRVAWGAMHWQYLERIDKITAHESPFAIRKQVMLKRASENGTELVPIGNGTTAAVGDRITIRIELTTDRFIDFVHLKDMRAAGLEPMEALSGTRWQGGLAYYQSVRDASVNFFFDRIPPGTHVLEYDLSVQHAGDLSNGITTAMCMYAPEFASHSAGTRLVIERR